MVSKQIFDHLSAESTLFTLSPSGLDDTLLAWTRAAVATPNELAAAGWTPKNCGPRAAARALACFAEPVGRRNELQVGVWTNHRGTKCVNQGVLRVWSNLAA